MSDNRLQVEDPTWHQPVTLYLPLNPSTPHILSYQIYTNLRYPTWHCLSTSLSPSSYSHIIINTNHPLLSAGLKNTSYLCKSVFPRYLPTPPLQHPSLLPCSAQLRRVGMNMNMYLGLTHLHQHILNTTTPEINITSVFVPNIL